ncbi:flavin reductase family protein [bacterium]
MKQYKELSLNEAYRVIGHGPVILVSSRSNDGKYNIAPIAWNSPIKKEPCQIIMEIGKRHKTYQNIVDTKEFIVSLPSIDQVEIVRNTGSSKGSEIDKFEKFNIESFLGGKIKNKVPIECIAYLEFKVLEIIEREAAGLIIGECVYASVDSTVFNERLLTEKKQAKTLHHLGGKVFCIPGDII